MRIRRFWQRKQHDEDLARKVESYLTHEMDENIAPGMRTEDARLAAGGRSPAINGVGLTDAQRGPPAQDYSPLGDYWRAIGPRD